MAIARQRPGPGLIAHSDRGVQNAAKAYRAALAGIGALASVVAQWHSSRRVWRRPREVEDAHKVLESFTELVREIRPALLLEGLIDLNAVRAARDALTHVLDEVEGDGVQR